MSKVVFEWQICDSPSPAERLWQELGEPKYVEISGYLIYEGRNAYHLWRLMDLDYDWEEVTCTRLDDGTFEVNCYTFGGGRRHIRLVRARDDVICPVCSKAWVHEGFEGEAERAFIRKWEACPCCMYDNLDYWELGPEKEAEAIKDLADLGWD